jgi:hypothetical protein
LLPCDTKLFPNHEFLTPTEPNPNYSFVTMVGICHWYMDNKKTILIITNIILQLLINYTNVKTILVITNLIVQLLITLT